MAGALPTVCLHKEFSPDKQEMQRLMGLFSTFLVWFIDRHPAGKL